MTSGKAAKISAFSASCPPSDFISHRLRRPARQNGGQMLNPVETIRTSTR